MTEKAEPREGVRPRKSLPPRLFRPTLAAALVGRVLDPATRRQGFADARLVTHWRDIVGAERAADTLPLKLERRSRTLILRVRPSAALLLQHEEPQLLERVNTFFGGTVAVRLRLVQGPVPRAAPEPVAKPLDPADEAAVAAAVADIEPAPLREALLALGRAVRGRERQRSDASGLERGSSDL